MVALLVISTFTVQSQKNEYSTLLIADSLKENANAVVRLNQVDIIIASQRNMNINTTRVITVLNEKGLSAVDAAENYDKKTTVKEIEATIYDAFGKEIKKIKRKDFKDNSAAGGGTLFSDSRYIYLDYTPTQYPFTVVYFSKLETSTTAFIPQWYPLSNFFVSVEKSILNVSYPANLGFKKMEFNFANFNINKSIDTATQLSYTATNIQSQKYEDYSPSANKILPNVIMGLEYFNLEGVDGNAKNWKEYGQWFSEKILTGTTNLSLETKAKIKALVGEEIDPIKKAKIIYKYVQEKSRYVAIQVGIGGFKPMLADDVDRLGYGDCKALSNYTRALLNAVDVPSYYTELYGSKEKRDIRSDFFSIQGNHVILAIPNEKGYVFLECTSQDDPFGYQANFTDDREVVVIKPEGGEIVRTKVYEDKDNKQVDKGYYSIDGNGNFEGKIAIVSEGTQYSSKAALENLQPLEKDEHYKQYWNTINNLKINNLSFSNDKTTVSFTEKVEISAVNYGNLLSGKMMFAINAYNQYTGSIKRIRNRKNPFEIQRGFTDSDEITVALPTEFAIEFLPSNFELKSKFGEYKTEFIKKEDHTIIYKRCLFIKKGFYSNTEYDEYRLFIEKVSRNDNAKIILTKNG